MAHLADRATRILLLTAAVVLVVHSASSEAEYVHGHDQSLFKYLLASRDIADPERVTYCFDTYLPIFSEINDDFMESFQKCSSDDEERKNKFEEAALGNRQQLEAVASGICVDFDACGGFTDALLFFDCYSEKSNDAMRVVYEMTQNSSKYASDLREQYLISEAEMQRCHNASRRVHHEHTARNYKDLDICLRGGNSSTETTTVGTTQTTESTVTDDPSTETTETPGTIPPYEPDDPNEPMEYKFDRNLKILPQLRKFY